MAGQAKFGAVNYVNGMPVYTDDQGNQIDQQTWNRANGALNTMSIMGGAYAGYQGGPRPQVDSWESAPPQMSRRDLASYGDAEPPQYNVPQNFNRMGQDAALAPDRGPSRGPSQFAQDMGSWASAQGVQSGGWGADPRTATPQPQAPVPTQSQGWSMPGTEAAPAQNSYQAAPAQQNRQWDNRPAQRWEPQGGIVATQQQRGWGNRPAQRWPAQGGIVGTVPPAPDLWGQRPGQRWPPQGGIVDVQPQRRGWANRPAQRWQPQGGTWGQGQEQPISQEKKFLPVVEPQQKY